MAEARSKFRTIRAWRWSLLTLAALCLPSRLPGAVVFEAMSAHHFVRVLDAGDTRTLCFDGAMETTMSLSQPLQGHFEYTEFFHLAWLWNSRLTNVLMIGLGGGSTQRSFQHHYPDVRVDTVELDPLVLRVARDFFHLKESPTLKVYLDDGRVFLRRATKAYDLIILDAYTASRYGSFLPHALTTKEFFTLARDRLSTNGVIAYNVMGDVRSSREEIVGALYHTMKSVFRQVYLFPARTSRNLVMIGTKSPTPLTLTQLQQRAAALKQQGRALPPWLHSRLNALRTTAPPSAGKAPMLTDDFAPVDGLLQVGW